MAQDGLFFRQVGKVHPQTRTDRRNRASRRAAIVIALLGTYDRILNYVVSVDVIFFGLTACCIFVFRKRQPATEERITRAGPSVDYDPIHRCLRPRSDQYGVSLS